MHYAVISTNICKLVYKGNSFTVMGLYQMEIFITIYKPACVRVLLTQVLSDFNMHKGVTYHFKIYLNISQLIINKFNIFFIFSVGISDGCPEEARENTPHPCFVDTFAIYDETSECSEGYECLKNWLGEGHCCNTALKSQSI